MTYKFEWNDLRALITIINVIIVLGCGLSIAWIALTIAALGLVNDFTTNKKINGFVIHSLNAIISIYLLITY
jgi:hypothetical protein